MAQDCPLTNHLKPRMRCVEGHQGAPAALLTQMRGNSHLLVLKEVRQQRQVSMQNC